MDAVAVGIAAPLPVSWSRWLLRRATVGVVIGVLPAFFALVALGWAPLAATILLFALVSALMVILERLIPRGGLGDRPPGTLGIDLAYAAISGLVNVAVPALWLIPFASAHALRWEGAPLWPQDLPVWLDVALCTLLIDFTSYWWHRLEHDTRVPLLWRLHSVHHAPRYFDYWMGPRVHPLDVVAFIVITAGLAAVLGVPTLTIEASLLLAGTIGGIHHLDAETDCGWLNRLVPFADHHTVHHSRAAHENGNFGNITTIWDQVFGSWLPPRPFGPQPTGAWSLVDDYPHTDFGFQLLSPFGRYWRRVRREHV